MCDLEAQLESMGRQSREAALRLANLDAETKGQILLSMADAIDQHEASILEANQTDCNQASENNISTAMLDRLRLTSDRVRAISQAIRKVANLPDPIGDELSSWTHPKGFQIQKVRVPIGVIGIIYESRPNVTSDAAGLCLKSGNATILRGGSEAVHSNRAIVKAMLEGGADAGMPDHAIQMVPSTDRESVRILSQMDRYVDLIIPRGGKGLIEAVVSQARVPVIKHYEGICHLYISDQANLDQAVQLVHDSKTQKPSVCNALETLLVHQGVAEAFLTSLVPVLESSGVEIRGDQRTCQLLGERVKKADPSDWLTEYNDLILSIKLVNSMDEAIKHINSFGSKHSDGIVTSAQQEAETFLRCVDSACVYHNVSTRFSDGEEFGFGAEIGISTEKLHARGPMGLAELTSYQYRIRGNGQLKGNPFVAE